MNYHFNMNENKSLKKDTQRFIRKTRDLIINNFIIKEKDSLKEKKKKLKLLRKEKIKSSTKKDNISRGENNLQIRLTIAKWESIFFLQSTTMTTVGVH